jgi:hypothetical protein
LVSRHRRAVFGSALLGLSGFTRFSRGEGQLKLDWLPLFLHETTGPTHHFQPFGLQRVTPPPMPSADFCAAFSEPCNPLSPDFEAATQTSWGKFNCLRRAPAGYTAMTLDGYGLRGG